MKNKGKIQTPSTTILNESNIYSSYNSKDISFIEIRKGNICKNGPVNFTRKQKNRASNSLDELTKKFVKFICESGDEINNLNAAIKKIKAKKRRIYDMTNVLEGIYKYIYNILYFYRDRAD